MRIKGGLCQHVYCEKEERAEAGSSGSARKAHWRSFACSCQKWATIIRCLKIRSPLVYPDMVCSVSEYEIVVERGFVLQAFHTCPKFGFVSCKKNRVHDSEIDFFRFIAIAAKDVFDCYVHGSIGLIEVFRVH